MIYEVEGDILLSRAQVIVQEVAVGDLMVRGFARKLKERYPVMVTEFTEWCQQHDPEPGAVWLWGSLDKALILNLITKQGDADDPGRPGKPTKLGIYRSLHALNEMALTERFTSIAMPKIGTGIGGLDWDEVRGMMHSQLGELLIPIFIYVLELDGQVAFEPGL